MAPEFLGEDYQLFHVLYAPASVFFILIDKYNVGSVLEVAHGYPRC